MHGFFQVSPGSDSVVGKLLKAAYRASRNAPVFVWARGVDPDRANRLLDPVVQELGVGYAGVEFIWGHEESRARSLADSAAFRVIAAP